MGATDITRVFLVSDCAAGDRRLMKELTKHISNVIVYTLGDSDAAKSFVKIVRPRLQSCWFTPICMSRWTRD